MSAVPPSLKPAAEPESEELALADAMEHIEAEEKKKPLAEVPVKKKEKP